MTNQAFWHSKFWRWSALHGTFDLLCLPNTEVATILTLALLNQAFRHLYVLATEPRCVEATDVASRRSAYVPLRIHLDAPHPGDPTLPGAPPHAPAPPLSEPAPCQTPANPTAARSVGLDAGGGGWAGAPASSGGGAAEARVWDGKGATGQGAAVNGLAGTAAVTNTGAAEARAGLAAGAARGAEDCDTSNDGACVERTAPCLLPERSQARPPAAMLCICDVLGIFRAGQLVVLI